MVLGNVVVAAPYPFLGTQQMAVRAPDAKRPASGAFPFRRRAIHSRWTARPGPSESYKGPIPSQGGVCRGPEQQRALPAVAAIRVADARSRAD